VAYKTYVHNELTTCLVVTIGNNLTANTVQSAHTIRRWVLFGSQNKQWLFP